MSLQIRVEDERAQAKTVYLLGRLDNETTASLDEQLETLQASPLTTVIFDLSGLEYVSSIGLRSFFRTQKIMKARGGKALLLNPQPRVQKVLEIVRVAEIGSVFRSVPELDAYLGAIQKKTTGE